MKTKSFIIIGVIILVVILLISNYQKIYKTVIPPNPVIVSSHADDFSSKLFDYSMKVMGEISNKGGDGYIIVEVTVNQGNNKWTKTKNIYLQSYQTQGFEIIFDEVELLSESPKYYVRAYALGTLK